MKDIYLWKRTFSSVVRKLSMVVGTFSGMLTTSSGVARKWCNDDCVVVVEDI